MFEIAAYQNHYSIKVSKEMLFRIYYYITEEKFFMYLFSRSSAHDINI